MNAQVFDLGTSIEDSTKDEWYTPSWMFDALGVTFDLDPCSPGAPPSSVWAKRHITKAENGLGAPWLGTVWLNPPFSSKGLWYERMVEHGDGIALMPARTRDHRPADVHVRGGCPALSQRAHLLRARIQTGR